jgi:hypothetical protein
MHPAWGGVACSCDKSQQAPNRSGIQPEKVSTKLSCCCEVTLIVRLHSGVVTGVGSLTRAVCVTACALPLVRTLANPVRLAQSERWGLAGSVRGGGK